ncbi:phosphatase PAP2 family protein [Luteipulveratus flavus]|uniref:Phosphatase PAP2 family protein n=1 Tax=Luteipulveratus flavus TaxID=3031728 RepID=A0ABT6C7D0_9MICO|nr:phosphatase PAP2 family protein [Luteipulveratus sp. YIM 133296]MDF8264844.1 phosphatase PAP2 family protein [Luteipulveratus sp. YIM 133296]
MRRTPARPISASAEEPARRLPRPLQPTWVQLLLACSPLTLVLLSYVLAQWISAPITARPRQGVTNRLGFGLHVTAPPAVDRAVFGVVPSAWLQQRLVGGGAHWYDAVAALVYVSHFVVLPVGTALVWLHYRDRFRAWITAVLTLTAVGMLLYAVYPAAPPWLASQQGAVAPVRRISGLGWDALGLPLVRHLLGDGQAGSNPVAAVPSLHAATPVLLLLFLWPVLRWPWRAALAAYAAVMAVALVYTGEHYVIDVVAGWATAVVAVAVAQATQRTGRGHRFIGTRTPHDRPRRTEVST